MAAQAWWNKPLPPGWEAKYDQNTKRYFFIDHSTKKTSWEDPRQQFYAAQHQQQHTGYGQQGAPAAHMQYAAQPNQHQAASAWASSLGQQTAASSQRQEIGMRDLSPSNWQAQVQNKYGLSTDLLREEPDEETAMVEIDPSKVRRLIQMFPSVESKVIRSVLQKNHDSEEASVREIRLLVKDDQPSAVQLKLSKDFPGVDTATVRDILTAVNNDENEARKKLRDLGYQDNQRSASPRPVTPVAKVTEAEKRKAKANLLKDFPNHELAVIDMALESCDHNESKARTLLKSMEPPPKKKTTPPKAKTSKAKSPDLKPEMSDAEKKRVRATLLRDFPGHAIAVVDMAMESCGFDQAKARTLLSSMETSPKKETKASSAAKKTSKASTASSVSSSAASSSSVGSRASTVSSVSTPTRSPNAASRASRTRPSPKRSVSPPPPTYESLYRTPPKGPENDLRDGPNTEILSGPDKNLLIKEYVPYTGPNRELASGPNREMLRGADASLAGGHNKENVIGPQPGLVGGSLYRPTVTSV